MNAGANQIVVYQSTETFRLDVRLESEAVWLNESRFAELLGVDQTVDNRNLHNIYKTGELEELATCAKIAQVQVDGERIIKRSIPKRHQKIWYNSGEIQWKTRCR